MIFEYVSIETSLKFYVKGNWSTESLTDLRFVQIDDSSSFYYILNS